MTMFIVNFLMGGLFAVLSSIATYLLIVSLGIYLIGFIIGRFIPKWIQLVPGYTTIMSVSAIVAVVCTAIKVAAFVSFMLTAQDKIDDLEQQVKAKDNKIVEMTQQAANKQVQADTVIEGDREAEIRYVTRYREVERLRTVPDLSLANRLMAELVDDFYDAEKVDEEPAIIK